MIAFLFRRLLYCATYTLRRQLRVDQNSSSRITRYANAIRRCSWSVSFVDLFPSRGSSHKNLGCNAPTRPLRLYSSLTRPPENAGLENVGPNDSRNLTKARRSDQCSISDPRHCIQRYNATNLTLNIGCLQIITLRAKLSRLCVTGGRAGGVCYHDN